LNAHTFATWFRPTWGHRIEGDVLVVRVPSPEFREWLDGNHAKIVADAVDACGSGVFRSVRFRETLAA
jgi:hypothetical protein